MNWLELAILSVCLCFDTFAVSLCGGILLCKRSLTARLSARIWATFALFQSGFLAMGWGVGEFFALYIESFDHWIAFLILLWIGGKMIYDSLLHSNEDNDAADLLNPRRLVLLSTATSIDAVAVGLSMALLQIETAKALFAIGATAAATAIASWVGLTFGKVLGKRVGNMANVVGGAVLIAIGVKIIIEHTHFFTNFVCLL